MPGAAREYFGPAQIFIFLEGVAAVSEESAISETFLLGVEGLGLARLGLNAVNWGSVVLEDAGFFCMNPQIPLCFMIAR